MNAEMKINMSRKSESLKLVVKNKSKTKTNVCVTSLILLNLFRPKCFCLIAGRHDTNNKVINTFANLSLKF